MLAGPATTGSVDLDRALGGLYWGDNVVFEVRRTGQALPFYAALAAETAQSGAIARVALDDCTDVDITDHRRPTRAARPARRPAAGGAGVRPRPRAQRAAVRRARPDGRAVGCRDHAAVLRAVLPAAARARRGRVLDRVPFARSRDAPQRRGRHHAVRARARRPPAARRQGRRAHAGHRGNGVRLPRRHVVARRARHVAPGRRPEGRPRGARPVADGAGARRRRLAERDLARRARAVGPVARHARRPGRPPRRVARRPPARVRRAGLPARTAPRSARTQRRRGPPAAGRCGCRDADRPRAPRPGRVRNAAGRAQGRRVDRRRVRARADPPRRAPRRAADRRGAVAERAPISGWRNLGDGEAVFFWILRD